MKKVPVYFLPLLRQGSYLNIVKTDNTMVQSMTGYGKANGKYGEKNIIVEIRTLNSRQTDIGIRTPILYREKESEIRSLLAEQLVRGKIDCSIYTEDNGEDTAPQVNREVVRNYFQQLKSISGEFQIGNEEHFLSIIMRLPDVLKTERPEISGEEWETALTILRKAMEEVREYRTREGQSIELDLKKRIEEIQRLLKLVEPLEKERRERIRNRIRNNLEEYLSSMNIDENRFEQEILYYLEKIDFSEEKSRLNHHCRFFKDTLKGEEPAGKKLFFIAQEIGREINTLGSKANDAGIQKMVVQMKDELEKIKEQLANML